MVANFASTRAIAKVGDQPRYGAHNGRRPGSVTIDLLAAIESRTHVAHGASLTLMNHPSNMRHSSPFGSYYVENNQSIRTPLQRDQSLTLQQGETLDLSYRYMVYDGKSCANETY